MSWQSTSSNNGAAGIWAKAEQLQKQAEAAILKSAQAVATTYTPIPEDTWWAYAAFRNAARW